jgi:hypothetical protein
MTIARLRQAKAALEREGSAEAAWLVGVIEEYETKAPNGVTLDRAAGLVPKPGGRPWWRVEERAQREAAVKRVAEEYFSDLSAAAAADEIARAARRLRVARDDSDAARLAAAKRPAARRRLSELAVKTDALPAARQIRRALPQRWP